MNHTTEAKKLGVFFGLLLIFELSCVKTVTKSTMIPGDGKATKNETQIGDNLITTYVIDSVPDLKYGYHNGEHLVIVKGDSLILITTENTIVIKGLHCVKCKNEHYDREAK